MLTFLVVMAVPLVPAERGVQVGRELELAASGTAPAVAMRGSEVWAAWAEYKKPQTPPCVKLVRLELPLEGPVQPQELSCEGGHPSVAVSPKAVLVVWSDGASIRGTAVRQSAASPAFRIATERQSYHVQAAFDGARFVVAWSDYSRAQMLRLSADGQLIDEKPVEVTRAANPGVDESALACSKEQCLVVARRFHGNSRTSASMVTLSGGAVGRSLSLPGNPFDVGAFAGPSGANVAMLSSYDQLVLQAPGEKPWAFAAERGERIRDVAGAAGADGTLVGWTREREGSARDAALLYIPPGEGAAQPMPVNLAREYGPSIATADGKTFVVLTQSRAGESKGGWPRVVARVIRVKPEAFAPEPAAPRQQP